MASHDINRRRTRSAPTRGPGEDGFVSSSRDIPDKLYFRIGEVAKLCELPTHVLRFWESEFPQLRPNKGGTGQRLYRRRDVEMALRIRTLLYDRGYTIPGARQAFKQEVRAGKSPQLALGIGEQQPSEAGVKHLRAIQKNLLELQAMLSAPASRQLSTRAGVQPIRKPKSDPDAPASNASGAGAAPGSGLKETLFSLKVARDTED